MEVKGTAFIARRTMLAQEFGEERVARLLADFAKREPVFAAPILATTVLPIKPFLALNDVIVRELYAGDVMSYWHFGEKSADWGLKQGPYRHLLATKSFEQFANQGRVIYAAYFNEGRAESHLRPDDIVELTLAAIPADCRHVYFEYAICGYFKRGLELVGASAVHVRRVRGFTRGDSDIFYEYQVER